MQYHKKTKFPKGFSCASVNCGLKDQDRDLSVFYSEVDSVACGLFTKNKFPGAPIILGREIIQKGILRAIVVNSKVSNVGTGHRGIIDARIMANAVAVEFKLPVDEIIMSSTGVVGVPLPIDIIEKGIEGISSKLSRDPIVGARGMMTTDTRPKALSCSVDDATLTIVAKGSGMIEPNMATMLVYIFTDAKIEHSDLDRMLRTAVNLSFNMLSVDTDTSTSDTCIMMANGEAGSVDEKIFEQTLIDICIDMAKILARDGEGATKLLISEVLGAKSELEAKKIAKSIINSPLVKTMAYGGDPNIGRVLMAVGKCDDCEIIDTKVTVAIDRIVIFENHERVNFDEKKIRKLLEDDEVIITVNLNVGEYSATAYGCDLSEGYIEENAAYYSS